MQKLSSMPSLGVQEAHGLKCCELTASEMGGRQWHFQDWQRLCWDTSGHDCEPSLHVGFSLQGGQTT